MLAVCLVLTAFVGTVDNPSGEAAIREGAADQAQQVATIRKVSRALSGVVGLSVGGLLVGAAGTEVAVAVDVGTYLAALVLLPPVPAARGRRRGRRRGRVQGGSRPPDGPWRRAWQTDARACGTCAITPTCAWSPGWPRCPPAW